MAENELGAYLEQKRRMLRNNQEVRQACIMGLCGGLGVAFQR